MANFFYTDADGKKQGPLSEQQLQNLARCGVIGRDTPIETEDGNRKYFPQLFTSEALKGDVEKSSGIFDLGFTRFITNTWISILWFITIFAHGIVAIIAVYAVVTENIPPVIFLLALIGIPLSLLASRMAFELDIIFFRIESNSRAIREMLEKQQQ